MHLPRDLAKGYELIGEGRRRRMMLILRPYQIRMLPSRVEPWGICVEPLASASLPTADHALAGSGIAVDQQRNPCQRQSSAA
jgi:hypothetical protein